MTTLFNIYFCKIVKNENDLQASILINLMYDLQTNLSTCALWHATLETNDD